MSNIKLFAIDLAITIDSLTMTIDNLKALVDNYQ